MYLNGGGLRLRINGESLSIWLSSGAGLGVVQSSVGEETTQKNIQTSSVRSQHCDLQFVKQCSHNYSDFGPDHQMFHLITQN